jgi:hypothetical protein
MKKGKIILLVIVLIAAFIGAKILYDQIIAWQRGQIMDGPGMDQGQMLVDNYGLTWEQAEAVLSGEVKLEDILNSSEPAPDQTNEPEETPGSTDEIAWNYDEFPDDYTFRNNKLLSEHYDKHGIEMGFASKEDYEAAANLVIHHPDVLHKIEKEDGDTCFYLESANAFVVLSTDGYIRTFFCPDSGRKYYDKQ